MIACAVAIASVQQATANKGPLNWTEVIGVGEASSKLEHDHDHEPCCEARSRPPHFRP